MVFSKGNCLVMVMEDVLDLNYDFYLMIIDDLIFWLVLVVIGFILVFVIVVGNVFLFFIIYKDFRKFFCILLCFLIVNLSVLDLL